MGICRNVREQKSMVCEVAFGLLECVMLRLEKTIRTNFKCSSKYGANETYVYIVPINLLEQVVFHLFA